MKKKMRVTLVASGLFTISLAAAIISGCGGEDSVVFPTGFNGQNQNNNNNLAQLRAEQLIGPDGQPIDISNLPPNIQGILAGILPTASPTPLPTGDPNSVIPPALAGAGPSTELGVPDLGLPGGTVDTTKTEAPLPRVIGADSRFAVVNTAGFPFRAQVKVFSTFANRTGSGTGSPSPSGSPSGSPSASPSGGPGSSSSSFVGSGTFIGPRHILTCAHNVWAAPNRLNPNSPVQPSQFATELKVAPGHTVDGSSNARAPYGIFQISKVYAGVGYIRNGDFNYDYAILELPASNPVGNQVGYLGFRVDTSVPDQSTANLSAYSTALSNQFPIQQAGFVQTCGAGTVARQDVNLWGHDIDMTGGASGGAVYTLETNGRFCIGVNVFESTSNGANGACRINRSLFDSLRALARPGN